MGTDKADIKTPKSRSATASWSGYNYQGTVGIYVALKKITELITEDSAALNNLNDFLIEYESPTGEDFDIKKGEKILSRHQVKATQGKTLCSYRTVIDIDKASSFNITGIDEDKRYLHVSENVEGWGLTEEQHKEQYPDREWVNNPKKIQLYLYDDNREYCPIREIDDKCSNLIQSTFSILNPDLHTPLQPGEAENRFLRILENLDGEITKAHESMSENVGKRTYPTISFKDIKDIMTGEDEISTNRDYERNSRRLKNKFSRSCEQAVENFILDNANRDQAKIEGFKDIYNKILRKSNEDFMDLIYNFSFRHTKDRSETDFEETALEKIIAEYIMQAGENNINIDKFLFDQLSKEKHILSGIVAGEKLSPSIQKRILNFSSESVSIRPWSADQIIVNQLITKDWDWKKDLISSTKDPSNKYSQDLMNPEYPHRFIEADLIRLRSVDKAIKIKNQETNKAI